MHFAVEIFFVICNIIFRATKFKYVHKQIYKKNTKKYIYNKFAKKKNSKNLRTIYKKKYKKIQTKQTSKFYSSAKLAI